jgi:2-C-methyl-D-erythritol 4-phosphate cytidylyltransferase
VAFDQAGIWAVVVAAGAGSRFGGYKQFEVLQGRRVLDWARQGARPFVEGIVLVVPPEFADRLEPGATTVVAGGATRSESVRNGLGSVPDHAEIIVVHDGARPLATRAMFMSVINAVREGADGAVPGLPVTDTVRRLGGGTVPREGLVTVQTPQAFRAELLREAHRPEPQSTDDASLVEGVGGKIVVVPGDPDNFKITDKRDLKLAGVILT